MTAFVLTYKMLLIMHDIKIVPRRSTRHIFHEITPRICPHCLTWTINSKNLKGYLSYRHCTNQIKLSSPVCLLLATPKETTNSGTIILLSCWWAVPMSGGSQNTPNQSGFISYFSTSPMNYNWVFYLTGWANWCKITWIHKSLLFYKLS